MQHPGLKHWQIEAFRQGETTKREDALVVEEPLEISLEYGPVGHRKAMNLSVTMRTPGHDEELALGFLLTEGIIASASDVIRLEGSMESNLIKAVLDPKFPFQPEAFQRHFYSSSSCGVCGKASIDMVRVQAPWVFRKGVPQVKASVIRHLADKLRGDQQLFSKTGGLHATGLFTPEGEPVAIREDVGRHNAMDKLIGWAMIEKGLPLEDYIVVVSGRAGFELIQKAWMAGLAFFVAVGAPSSLAVELADQQEMTLIGFLREEKWNVYCGIERVVY